ncbi:acyltransferase family protein, partial [Singulisphaera rosea]
MSRVPELDAIRGIASVAILMFHLRFMKTYPMLGTAIDLFFVLSGYLITSILLKSDRSFGSLRTFYIRRAWRIWPIYYLAFAVFFAVNVCLSQPMPTAAWPYYLSYTQFVPGYWSGSMPPFSRHFDHTWTLAIEEQFYMVWPLLVCLTGRRTLMALVFPCLACSVVMRASGFPRDLLLSRTDGLVLGGLLAALLFDGERLERHRSKFRAAFAVLGTFAATVPFWGGRVFGDVPLFSGLQAHWPRLEWIPTYVSLSIFRMSVVYFSLVGLIVCSPGHRFFAPLRNKWLCHLGQISYGLYLYHPFVFILTIVLRTSLGFKGSAWYDVFRVACCFAAAALSWRYIEQPLLALRDRITEGT